MTEQPARFSHEAAAVGSRTWIWGGANHIHCIHRSHVMSYDPVVQLWTQHEAQATSEDHVPLPSLGSRCTAVDTTIYSFGGQSPGIGYLNDLYAFDTTRVAWRKVHTSGNKPSPRRHCGLCSTDGRLLVFGGYGPPKEDDQQGTQWVETGDGKGVNNEFYEFNMQTGQLVDQSERSFIFYKFKF